MRFSLIFLSLSLLLIARDFVEGAKLNFVASLTEKQSPLDVRSESLKGCSMSSLNKCYGSLPPDGSRPNNLLEEIGQVSDAQTCQSFCKDLYRDSCAWFIFDRTTNDCKLFSGSLDDLRADCKEVGYAKEPNHSSCDAVFDSDSSNGCYNFREDYCRFEFSLLENLEDIETLSECQLACQYINNCSYFVYDTPTKICKLNTIASSRPICDIIHGTPEPDFNSCVNDGNLDWASNANNPQTSQSSSNDASPVDCLWGSYGEWSTCSKTCGGGERTRTRNETTPAANGGQECVGDSTETENCNQEECQLEDIIIQRNQRNSEEFHRTWDEYKNGFGSVESKFFWLGLDKIHNLTKNGAYSLEVILMKEGNCGNCGNNSITWSTFSVADEANNYRLSVGGFNKGSTALEDKLRINNGKPFTTKDKDNDDNSRIQCAQQYWGKAGGWWFTKYGGSQCGETNLNWALKSLDYGIVYYNRDKWFDESTMILKRKN